MKPLGWNENVVRHVIDVMNVDDRIPIKLDYFVETLSNNIITMNMLVTISGNNYLLENVISPQRNHIIPALKSVNGISEDYAIDIGQEIFRKLAVNGYQFWLPKSQGILLPI